MDRIIDIEGILKNSGKKVNPLPYIVQISVCSRISSSWR